jgi:hypothetical protein
MARIPVGLGGIVGVIAEMLSMVNDLAPLRTDYFALVDA